MTITSCTLYGKVTAKVLAKRKGFAVCFSIVGGKEAPNHGYSVTHIASGWAVRDMIPDFRRAVDLASRCAKVAEWELLDPKKLRPRKGTRCCVAATVPAPLVRKMRAVMHDWFMAGAEV